MVEAVETLGVLAEVTQLQNDQGQIQLSALWREGLLWHRAG